MKKISKIIAIASILLAGFNSASFAQATASATASATIVTPISISKTADMNFGNVAVSAVNAGTVVLTPTGSRTATSGVTLPAVNGTVAAASFHITGQGNYTYAITLPTSLTITDGASHSMTVNNFTSNPSATGTLSSGSQTLNVGATLNVAAGQAAGTYAPSGAGFDVTVNYN